MDNLRALVRYNLQIVMANTLWVLILPLIFTVLTVGGLFLQALLEPRWTFYPSRAAGLAEGLMPILGAFICAHILDVELRQGAGEVLHAKAYPLWRTVALRTLLGLGVVLLFGLLGLGALRLALGEFSLVRVWLAALPSTLFLAMLGLLVAIRLQNALLSLILPLILWFLDFTASWFFNPLLSLSTYKYFLLRQQGEHSLFVLFADWWWVSKIGLAVLAGALFLRTVTTLERGR